MTIEREDFIGQATLLVKYISSGAPLPAWMDGKPRSRKEVDGLSPVQQIGHSISREIEERFGATVRPGTSDWRKRFNERMKEVLADYYWLS